MIYLLDANVWVQFLRQRHARVVQRIQARQPSDVRVCSVVASELYHGCLCSAHPAANRAKVDAVLQPYLSLPFDDTAADLHARIRHHLESLGTPIGPYDLQIAAIALVTACALVTHNTAEFARVPGLLIEDWEFRENWRVQCRFGFLARNPERHRALLCLPDQEWHLPLPDRFGDNQWLPLQSIVTVNS
jgi:tRNA(fMet)-specific endonuclease VapC